MKKFRILSFCLTLALVFGASFPVFAAEEAELDPSVDLSDTALSSQASSEFHKKVADDEAFIHLVVTAAQKKGRDVSLEGVHPDKCIKLYGLKNSENLLQSLYDAYTETGRIQSRLSEDYAVLVLYTNADGEYVDSFVFTRKENLPEAQDKNGWVPLGSGSLTSDDEFLKDYLKEGSLKKYLKGLGLKGTNHLKLVTAIPYFPPCIYFVQKNEEFLLPLDDGRAGIKACQVYRMSDIAENFLKPILDYQNELTEKFADLDPLERPLGIQPVPDTLPTQVSVDLNTYFDAGQETPALNNPVQPAAAAALATPEETADTFPWLPVILGAAAVLLLAGGVVFAARKRNAK